MSLEFVKPAADLHLNVLLYGPPKSGKTVGAASAPAPVLLVNADRPNASLYAHKLHGEDLKEVRMESLSTLIAVHEAARSGEFETVVLDTVGEIYRLVLEGISGRAVSPQIQQYGDTGVHVERFIRNLIELPINVVLVLHENIIEGGDGAPVERSPYTGTNKPTLANKLMAMVDVIGYTGILRTEAEDGDEPEVRYVAQLADGGGRHGGTRFGSILGLTPDVRINEWVVLTRKAMEADKGSGKDGK